MAKQKKGYKLENIPKKGAIALFSSIGVVGSLIVASELKEFIPSLDSPLFSITLGIVLILLSGYLISRASR